MNEMQQKFTSAVTAALGAASPSAAKSEVIEELSDNLYQRYLDLTASGTSQEAAYRQALDCLGDTGELVEYLNSLKPDESLPELVLRPGQGDSSQLEDLLKNVEEIVKGALGKAKSALKDAKDMAENSLGVSADDIAKEAREKVGQAFQKARDVMEGTINPGQADGGESTGAPEQEREPSGSSHSWQFTAGYDKDRGGFYAQWGKPKGGEDGGVPVPLDEPVYGEALTGLDVQVSGDVTIHLTEEEDGDVVILGFDTTLTYEKLRVACDLIRAGRPVYGVNPDWNCPVEGGFIPDCGSIAALVKASTGVQCEFFGKPSPHTLEYMLAQTGCRPQELAVVGDRLYTDIAVAAGTEVASILVMSGETTPQLLAESPTQPDIVVQDLGELTSLL